MHPRRTYFLARGAPLQAIQDGERLGVPVPVLNQVYQGIRAKWFGNQ